MTRRSKRYGAVSRVVLHELDDPLRSATFFLGQTRHVDVVGAGILENQPDELASSLDDWPVVELVR